MSSTTAFFVGILVQVALAILQVGVLVFFVYRWQRISWRYGYIMKIREPLARAYCSLSAVVRARRRLLEDANDQVKAAHEHARIHHYLTSVQDEIVNFSVEHFKTRFWMSKPENQQLDLLFAKLREVWKLTRNSADDHEIKLDDLRSEILKFDDLCGFKDYNNGQWSHVALH